jgi:hypothetical protein
MRRLLNEIAGLTGAEQALDDLCTAVWPGLVASRAREPSPGAGQGPDRCDRPGARGLVVDAQAAADRGPVQVFDDAGLEQLDRDGAEGSPNGRQMMQHVELTLAAFQPGGAVARRDPAGTVELDRVHGTAERGFGRRAVSDRNPEFARRQRAIAEQPIEARMHPPGWMKDPVVDPGCLDSPVLPKPYRGARGRRGSGGGHTGSVRRVQSCASLIRIVATWP